MTVIQRCFAVLSAAALLLTASAAGVPVPVRTAQNGPVSAFAAQLRNRKRGIAAEPFARLCYDSGSGILLRDGEDAGGRTFRTA